MIIIELDGITIKISKSVINNMMKFKQDAFEKPEAGGILIGYYIQNNSFSITDITTPTLYDKSSRFNFIRNIKSVQSTLKRLFKKSGGKKIYLGEWHTHPENTPTPSGLDNKSIIDQLKFNQLNSDIIFMIIIGRNGFYISSVKKWKIISFKTVLYIDVNNTNNAL